MTNREAIHKLIMFRRILERGVFPLGYRFDAEPFDLAVSALEKLEQDRWIPVTERLPEKDDFVLVTISGVTSNGISWEHTMTLAVWTGDSWDLVDADMADFKIFAWRPLPEPYTEEES